MCDNCIISTSLNTFLWLVELLGGKEGVKEWGGKEGGREADQYDPEPHTVEPLWSFLLLYRGFPFSEVKMY